ncbi:MAG: hypothetical protein AB7I35_21835 [Ramlibacter sp.]
MTPARRTFLALALAAAAGRALANAEPLRAYLARVGPANAAAWLQQQAEHHAGIRYFNLGWDWPHQIQRELDRHNLATVGDFMAWVDRKAQHMAHTDVQALEVLLGKVPPGLDPAQMPLVTVERLHRDIFATQAKDTGGICGLAPDHEALPVDRDYRLPTAAQWDALLQAYPGAREPFAEVANDCDKSVRNFSGWLAGKRLGVLAMATCRLQMWQGSRQLQGHVVAMVADSTGRAWFLEPQTRARYGLSHTAFLGYSGLQRADRTRIGKLIF